MIEVVAADWPAPPQIRAIQTTRVGGVSGGAYDSLNLGSNTGDDPAAVRANRQHLREGLKLLAEQCWLRQVHGTRVVDAAQCVAEAPAADEIGSASCRERECQYVEISVVAVSVNKKKKKN